MILVDVSACTARRWTLQRVTLCALGGSSRRMKRFIQQTESGGGRESLHRRTKTGTLEALEMVLPMFPFVHVHDSGHTQLWLVLGCS